MNKDLLKFGEKASLERKELAVVAKLIGKGVNLTWLRATLTVLVGYFASLARLMEHSLLLLVPRK